jgi:ascorbate-specific PTS system EIIC-type component UlaA
MFIALLCIVITLLFFSSVMGVVADNEGGKRALATIFSGFVIVLVLAIIITLAMLL